MSEYDPLRDITVILWGDGIDDGCRGPDATHMTAKFGVPRVGDGIMLRKRQHIVFATVRSVMWDDTMGPTIHAEAEK